MLTREIVARRTHWLVRRTRHEYTSREDSGTAKRAANGGTIQTEVAGPSFKSEQTTASRAHPKLANQFMTRPEQMQLQIAGGPVPHTERMHSGRSRQAYRAIELPPHKERLHLSAIRAGRHQSNLHRLRFQALRSHKRNKAAEPTAKTWRGLAGKGLASRPCNVNIIHILQSRARCAYGRTTATR